MKFSTSDIRIATQHIPPSLRVVFESDQTGDLIEATVQKHGLDMKHLGLLSDQVAYVLLGLLKKEQFHESVMRELNLRPSEADAVCAEVEENIFKHVATDLAQFSSGGAPKFTAQPPSPTIPTPPIQPKPEMPSTLPEPVVQSSWPIPLNPVVTEATPASPRTLSTPPSTQITPEPAPQPLPRAQAAPLPPPPKEELVVPHKSGSQHTSNMPGMRHPWLSDPIKLPTNVAPTPGAVKESEKKGLTEKPKAPTFTEMSASMKKEGDVTPTAPAMTQPTQTKNATPSQSVTQSAPTPANVPAASKAQSVVASTSKPSAEPSTPTSTPSKPLSQTTPEKEITSTEVIMPGKGVNIPVPKMVSRLPIEERDASRITIVRKQVTETPKTIVPKASSASTSQPTSPSITPSTPNTPKNVDSSTSPIPATSTPDTIHIPIKAPAPGSISPEMVRPAKAPTPSSTSGAPIYQGGKDPYREPVN